MSFAANDKMRLIITGKCNLDCFYCHNEGQAKEESFIQLSMLRDIASALLSKSLRVNEVTISGGEPLLHPQLDEIVELSASFCDRVTMVSNGLLAIPARLESLARQGLKKLRLGVDSLDATKPRPSPGYLREPFILREVLKAAGDLGLKVDLNVVVTKFNRDQCGTLARFAIAHGTSIKFFEHVEVSEFGANGIGGSMAALPHTPFKQFEAQIGRALDGDARFEPAQGFGEANLRLDAGGVEIRYCRYLCDYRLCWLTGTRIDARRYAYNCMSNRGIDRLPSGQNDGALLETLRLASARPCRADVARAVVR